MRELELLSPARDLDTGIAAIDCGADAVYIAGPEFGARKAAGNDAADIAALASYAHKFGARVFVTFNTVIRDDELGRAHVQMLQAQEAGADAFIIRDERVCEWDDVRLPLHASTQCAIRDAARAVHFEKRGCSRLILERELDIDTIRSIRRAVSCELEFFVHGALCVCYSGECRLSEYLDGRSADRGECIQACRSLYDLTDAAGKVLVRNKALLSLKDYNLKSRLEELADAGITSFKIEGRLKNVSYVKNVTRDYDMALREIISRRPDDFRRASWGSIHGGFSPDTDRTFNRGYTQLWIDGKRGKWSSMDAPKSMGERIGSVKNVRRMPDGCVELSVALSSPSIQLKNGDGFAFTAKDGIMGFRGDVCEGGTIVCRPVRDMRPGTMLYRNINAAFEKILDTQVCHREISVGLEVHIHGHYDVDITAVTEDGRVIHSPFRTDVEQADNVQRAEDMIRGQLSKRTEHYYFEVKGMSVDTPGGSLPLLSASTINSMRRLVAEDISRIPCMKIPLGIGSSQEEKPLEFHPAEELMRSKYCVRYELGLCPKYQGASSAGPLFLVNNGRRLSLHFDCSECEMTVAPART